MGEMNIDLCPRVDDDGPALRRMMTCLGLISCAEARWPDSHRGFLAHRAGEGQAHSYIGYIRITESQAALVRRFGVDADATLMHDFDHAVLFADVGVAKVIGLTSMEEVTTSKRRRPEIRYSDKQGLERFRTFAKKLHEKRGFDTKCKTSSATLRSLTIVYDSKARTTGRNGRGAAGTQCTGTTERVALTMIEAFGGELTRRWRSLMGWRRQLTWGLRKRTAARGGDETSLIRNAVGRATNHARLRQRRTAHGSGE